ncbi:MAG: ACP phosphodiesterase [Bernardetiaceae bacterium]
MNFLAHAFLSRLHPLWQVGGFLGDFVKGNSFDNAYPPAISAGIRLHRQIDAFTDSHALIHRCNALLYPTQGKYAPVLTDVFFDHLLAKHWATYTNAPLQDFVRKYYTTLHTHQSLFPPKAQRTYTYMHAQDWLTHYATEAGIRQALRGLHRRARFPNQINNAWPDFLEHQSQWETAFAAFMPAIMDASQKTLTELVVSQATDHL